MKKRRAKKAIRKALGLRPGRICPKEIPAARFARQLVCAIAETLNMPVAITPYEKRRRKYDYAQGRRDWEAYQRLTGYAAGREASA